MFLVRNKDYDKELMDLFVLLDNRVKVKAKAPPFWENKTFFIK